MILTSILQKLKNWLSTTDLGIVWIVLIILGIIVGILLLCWLILGIVIGIPALVLLLAWNWVIPVFGGPSICYWTAVGLVILIEIIYGIIHR